ncbi:MAG: ParB/RepB/Spo0J family partition protein [Planctomycetes bacterium]|nr:ParB/RepB/Spo0J family partition protein [Planctomycetota bacterium]
MADRKLGRGLDYLIQQDPSLVQTQVEPDSSRTLRHISIDRIAPNPNQPRGRVGDDSIQELAASIQEAGLMQPLVVRPVDAGLYELVAGERRLRACRLLGWAEVPAVVREVESSRMLELALIENIQRKDLNPIECARALREMMDTLQLTQEEVAGKVGKQRSSVANYLRLLELPEDIQEDVSRGTLTMGHARALLSLPDDATKRAMVQEILSGGLSVRSVERRAALARARSGVAAEKPPYLVELQQKLEERLGMPVQIQDRAGRGKVTVWFRDHKEFDRLFARLTRPVD